MAQTILFDERETTIEGATAEGGRCRVPLADLERVSGWKLEPRGLCRGEVCVPIPPGEKTAWVDDEGGGRFDLSAFGRHLGRATVRDEQRGVWSFGPPSKPASGPFVSGGGPVEAPDFELPDLDGKLHRLSEHRGKKVLLLSWASW